MDIRSFGRFALIALASLGLASCGINTVPTKEEAAKAQWGVVQSAYQRRADLIPNLVQTVKAAATSENQILTNVIEARAKATAINVTTQDLSNPETFNKFQAAQNQLTQALGQLRTVVEKYPELQSQQRFADLMTALEGSENRINVERDRYNQAAQDYNTTIRTFPSIMAAKIVYGSKPLSYFTAAPNADTAPSVDFGNMGASPGAAPGGANDNAAPGAAPAAAGQ
ncbi:LemA family protein [Tsuneonella mangrovi]|uniref:LemA family protein n=1 Tax=Tsuneonella mangrovi TaxID=1982042 RepID=UPI000BA275DE|nr:LemA family protein [Tsuneonella mangrovi]